MKRSRATVGRLLRRNLSKIQIAGFILSNFIGLAIIISGIQFYADIRPIVRNDESFINQDYIIVNKKVTASHMLGTEDPGFTSQEIEDMEAQPWLRRAGIFQSADYEVRANLSQGDRGMQTGMFLESIPDSFIDVEASSWHFSPGDGEVPVIISKDYLTLYNFGFASAAGLPKLSEGMLSAIPLTLSLASRSGTERETVNARIVGFSSRLNTILVPESFMEWSNSRLGSSPEGALLPSRLILEVRSPGDVAIARYLEDNGLERAGDDRGSQAAYFLKLVSGVVIAIGGLITLLSLFILLLSVALLMQKNRAKLHLLIMLGYPLRAVGRPYETMTLAVSLVSYALAVIAMLVFRNIYIAGVSALADQSEVGVAVSLLCGAALVALIWLFNILAIRRSVKASFR